MVSSSPVNPSLVWSSAGPAGVDCVEVGADELPVGTDELVPGDDGFVFGADGNRCWVGWALVVGPLLELPSGQTMTMTTAATTTTAMNRAPTIQTAGLCHHGDAACACCVFGAGGGDHVGC